MIVVKTVWKKDLLQEIAISGHAEYADFGKDIVCSSVSTCVITTVNAIYRLQEDAIFVEEEKNKIIIHLQKQDQIVLQLLLNMLEMLQDLEKQYPKNVRLSKEEI